MNAKSVQADVDMLNAELAASNPALLSSNALLAVVLVGSGDCIKILDLDGRLTFMSEGGKRVMEVDDFSALKGCPWPDFWEGQGNIAARQAVEDARSGKVGAFEGPARTAKGALKYWSVRLLPILDKAGHPFQLLSISQDITAQKDAEAKADIIRSELHHRIKNIIATVSAIVSQSLRGPDLAGPKETLQNRLGVLARSHDLLNETAWAGASLRSVIDEALEVYQFEKTTFIVSGPDIPLSPRLALSLAMAMHELATNATKYGALSNDHGRVAVDWTVDPQRGEEGFRLTWREIGGPPVRPPSQRGFGSRIINEVLASDFRGNVILAYEPRGVVCTLTCDVESLAAK